MAKTKLDRILDTVKCGKREVTIDAGDLTRAQVDRIYATAKARGLHAGGTNRWILVRDLSCMNLGRGRKRKR